ncbi:MAG: DUF4446 family protein [Chloroflexota bacterium]|nr:DUF4446 family protein [Chloroflexota bacterium]
MTALIQDNLGAIIGLLIVLLGVALVLAVAAWRRAVGTERHLEALTRGEDGRSLQGVLEAHLGRVAEVANAVDRLTGRTSVLEADGRKAFQRIGLVRFNPFEDTGSNQSFALALLDADDDGIVVSSLHARGGTRIYAKAVAAGRPEATLSDEEAQALALARGAAAGRVALADRAAAGVGGR